ncbi:MAG: hypothetical protein OXD36_13750 [Rhodobacter sp.]|nr:hypothetical protein [Rhodobacter sp.]
MWWRRRGWGGGPDIRVSVEGPETDGERAREAARKLYAAFTQTPSITRLRAAPAAYDEFRAAGDDDGHSQTATVSGDPFGDVADGDIPVSRVLTSASLHDS